MNHKCKICGNFLEEDDEVIIRNWQKSQPLDRIATLCKLCTLDVVRSVSLYNGEILVNWIDSREVQSYFTGIEPGKTLTLKEALAWTKQNEEQLRNYGLLLEEANEHGFDVFTWEGMPDWIKKNYVSS